jgi:hypothetical protein
MGKQTQRKSGGDRKHGRNMGKCKRYRDQNRLERNKKRKAATLKRRQEKKRAKLLRRNR